MLKVPEPPRGTGRTARMLAYAVKMAKRGKSVMIYGNDATHAKALSVRITSQYCPTKRQRDSKWRRNITCMTFTDIDGTLSDLHYSHPQWDWSTAAWSRPTKSVLLVDHYALESRLFRVRMYLETSKAVQPVEWMAATAAMLAAQGTKTLVISNSMEVHNAVYRACRGIDTQVLTQSSTECRHLVNFRHLALRSCAPSPVLIFDPQMIHDMFAASIKEIDRWN